MLEEIERLIKEYAISQGLDEVRAEIYAVTLVRGPFGGIEVQIAAITKDPGLISEDMVKAFNRGHNAQIDSD